MRSNCVSHRQREVGSRQHVPCGPPGAKAKEKPCLEGDLNGCWIGKGSRARLQGGASYDIY